MGSKTIREIVSPETRTALDTREEVVAGQKQMLRDDLSRRETPLTSDGGADVTNPLVQLGRAVTVDVMMRRLKKMNSALRFEVSVNYPDIMGIYMIENRPDPITNRSPWKRHICGMPNGLIAEFHSPITVIDEVPDPDLGPGSVKTVELQGQKPGWRSILLRLIKEGSITPAQAEKEFKVSQGRSSARWQSALVTN